MDELGYLVLRPLLIRYDAWFLVSGYGSLKNSSSMKMSLQEIHDLRTLLEKIS